MPKDVKFRPKKILFTIGSPNQASQMHQIASLLPEYDCYFTQLYSKHPVVKWFMARGYLETTILSGEFKRKGDAFLQRHGDGIKRVYESELGAMKRLRRKAGAAVLS